MSVILDTRDLEERRAKLQDEFDNLVTAIDEAQEEIEANTTSGEEDWTPLTDAEQDLKDWKADNQTELDELTALENEIPEWNDGNALIPENEWVDYVKEMLVDCGDIPANLPWYIAVDWDQTAENISADYGTIEYQGDTYYFRNC